MSGPPHISHDSRDGWFRKVHRGHWKEAPGSDVAGGLSRAAGDSLPPTRPALPDNSRGRSGSGDMTCCRLVTLLIAALSRCVKAGFMPQARHGGKGVWALADAGSKLDGTGFE